MRKWIAGIMNCTGIALMVILVAVFLPLTVPKLFGVKIFGVLTGSMTPAYPTGCVVYVEPCAFGQVEKGDVVTYRLGADESLVMTHRVVEKDGEAQQLYTKGDANNEADAQPVRADRLVGRVVFSLPFLGTAASFISTLTGKAVCFILFAAALILWISADLLARLRVMPGNGGEAGSGAAASPAVKAGVSGDGKSALAGAVEAGSGRPVGAAPAVEAGSGRSVSTDRDVGTAAAGKKTGKRRSVWMVRSAGILLIVCSLVYIVSVLLDYRRGEEQYGSLEAGVFAGLGGDSPSEAEGAAPDVSSDEDDWSRDSGEICARVANLREQYPDMVGWIAFDRLDISYPVMRGEDNEQYLYHTYSGEANKAGSIFMEAQNEPDFGDSHTILYGHNMKNGTMFGQLKKFRQQDFYDDNSFFTVYTENKAYRYLIFAYYDISEYGDVYRIAFDSDQEFEELLAGMRKRSYYDTETPVSSGDRVITLSTCSAKGKRFVVHAKLIAEAER